MKQKAWKLTLLLVLCALLLAAGCEAAPAPSPTPVPTQTPAPTPEQSPSPTLAPEATPEGTAEPDGEYSFDELDGVADPDDVLPSYETYEEAKSVNEDVIGWITIPGTAIDYPVVIGEDNDYYVGRNVNKEKSKHGAIFMDYRNANPDQQQHVLIYGHNMRNGTMFHDLMNYKQKAFFDENRYIYFRWNDSETIWQIYLASIVTSYNVQFSETRFFNGDNFADFMGQMKEYAKMVSPSIIDEGITIGSNDQVLTLSTCTYELPNSREQRFVVQARRIK